MDRRRFLAYFGVVPVVSACGNKSAVSRNIGVALDQAFGNSSAFDPAYALGLPYASLAVRQEGAARALLILGKVEAGELHWISADRGVLVTRRGRVVRTIGLRQDLRQTQFVDADFLGRTPLPDSATRRRRQIDLMPGNRFGMLVEAEFEVLGEEEVDLISGRRRLVKCRERCYAPQLDWRNENLFWVEASSGRVWRSRQQPGPEAPELDIELVKPAAEA